MHVARTSRLKFLVLVHKYLSSPNAANAIGGIMFFRIYLHLGNGRVIDIKSFRVVESTVSTSSSQLKELG